MAEYIEREALMLQIDLHGTNKFGMLDEDIREFIKKQPAADVVEVVRCKDCTHWSEKIGMCLYCYGLHYNAINPSKENDFCSYGERRSV